MRIVLFAALLAACTPKELDPVEDADLDGYPAATDCDDTDPAVHPDAAEVCNGVDDDCDGTVDDGAIDASQWFDDVDGDGYGDSTSGARACQPATGQVSVGGDCDDTDTAYHPGAAEDDCTDPNDYNCDGITPYDDQDEDGWPACEDCDDTNADVNPDADEVCNDIDDDCDGTIDEDDALDAPTWYADDDSDSYGDPEDTTTACDQPTGYVSDDTDCDDTESTTHPGADEYCDGHDDDCDDEVDEDDAVDATTWYADADEDGFGDPDVTLVQCYEPSGYTDDNDDDCDDTRALSNPDADEYCNTYDDDCDGTVDEDDAVDAPTWYADADSDGYGDADDSMVQCSEPTGYVEEESTDCDDTDAEINPGETEYCDGVDNDCSGDESGVVTFTDSATGTATDASTDFASGTSGSPYELDDDTDGTLAICPGTYYVHGEFGGDDLTIVGPYGSASTILDGGASGTILALSSTGATVSVTGITFQDGDASFGGCIGSQDDSLILSLDDVIVQDCSGSYGGGVYLSGGTVTLSETTLDGNVASTDGGGLYIAGQSSSSISFDTCEITGNTAGDNGGGIYSGTADVELADTTVSTNTATDENGGGVYADSGDIDLDTVILSDNTSGADGAGVYVGSGDLTALDCELHDNDAGDDAGAIRVTSGTITLTDSYVYDNTAADNGGAFDGRSGSEIYLYDTLVETNVADDLGGGVYVQNAYVYCEGDSTVDAGFWGNDAGGASSYAGGGAFLEWTSAGADEPGLHSEYCDWGIGTDTNTPEDIVAEKYSGQQIRANYNDNQRFACDTSSCAAP